jgi:hypothetical protein
LYLPQVESWTSNSFLARAAVEVKAASAKEPQVGVVWFEAHGSVDHSNRVVTLDRMAITRGSFPDTPDNGSNALAIVREVLPGGARTVSLDYLITALGFNRAAAREGAAGLKNDPPEIVWVTNRTVLIRVDGEPVLRPVAGSSLERVINTPALLVRNKTNPRFYLEGGSRWYAADSIGGPWSLVQNLPAQVASLDPTNTPSSAPADDPPPQIMVTTKPAELLMTVGPPDYRRITDTSLQYIADSDSQVFFDSDARMAYLLISGRWFKSASLRGPWTYVSPRDLPADFAKIPPNSPQAIALASVPDTRQAEMALVAGTVPTTATVSRKTTTLKLTYDGEPEFKPIEGTKMTYAVNAQVPVIKSGDKYYAVDNAVWFTATSATGPWEVADEVPEEIYTIPPSSPVYYATFVRVYDADDENVETGYTSGYQGSYEQDGTTVYGTGWDYQPWTGNDYYGWGWSWGYCYYYVPWYQWWLWRPGWGGNGELRAALIENIYDRWQTPGVTPHDRTEGALANRAQQRQGSSGFPALYGRFQGSTRPAALSPPANTLALNPYARPETPIRTGDMPHGAQLLTTLRQSPGGGRDLYASPDGNVYRRQQDGWYRSQAGGKWSYAGPIQGQLERASANGGRGVQPGALGAGYRVNPGAGAGAARPGLGDRVPDTGNRLQARQVADLERQYYARNIAQMRAQNFNRANYSRPANVSRPAVRTGGRR